MVEADKGIGAEEVKQRDKRGATSKVGGDEEGEDGEALDVTGGRSGSFTGGSTAYNFVRSYYTVVK